MSISFMLYLPISQYVPKNPAGQLHELLIDAIYAWCIVCACAINAIVEI